MRMGEYSSLFQMHRTLLILFSSLYKFRTLKDNGKMANTQYLKICVEKLRYSFAGF